MPAFSEEDYERAVRALNENNQRLDYAPTARQKLRWPTVICLVLNRTIGSGIFVTPSRVLGGTSSVGASLLLWGAGSVISTCGMLVWLELGLSLPIHHNIPGVRGSLGVPRSGGEKNYLEFMLPKPEFLAPCLYGIAFIVLGNLSGNAIAFGSYVMEAAGYSNPSKGSVLGIAIAALTLSVLLHLSSRRGGIMLNNAFAVLKVSLLVAMIIMGFVKAGGKRLGGQEEATANFKPSQSFSGRPRNFSDYTTSLLFVLYTYNGFEQPFYVLSEVSRPRRTFPWAMLTAMLITVVLVMLMNIAYLCVVPKEVVLGSNDDMATLFFTHMFGAEAAKRSMSALIAFSILGNLVVMTFTASRVKQEIAKEGIIPGALFFATGRTSLYDSLKAKLRSRGAGHVRENMNAVETARNHPEQTPMAALGLHWFTSIFLIAVTAMLVPDVAYSVLVSLYSYVIVLLLGFLVSLGLVYQYVARRKGWIALANYRPWLSPLPAVVYMVTCGILVFAAFVPPSVESPYHHRASRIRWYIIPTIGLSSPLWGFLWYVGLRLRMLWRREWLNVRREALIVEEEGEWIQRSELVEHAWQTQRVMHEGQ